MFYFYAFVHFTRAPPSRECKILNTTKQRCLLQEHRYLLFTC